MGRDGHNEQVFRNVHGFRQVGSHCDSPAGGAPRVPIGLPQHTGGIGLVQLGVRTSVISVESHEKLVVTRVPLASPVREVRMEEPHRHLRVNGVKRRCI